MEKLMRFPDDRKYSDSHVWVQPSGHQFTLGLSKYALEELGGISYIELPAVNTTFARDEPFVLVETSKAVTEIPAPISGVVTRINEDAAADPEIVVRDPYGAGALLELKPQDPDEWAALMTAAEYAALVDPAEE